MTPLRTPRGGVELWRCEQCGAEVVFVDDSTWDGAEATAGATGPTSDARSSSV